MLWILDVPCSVPDCYEVWSGCIWLDGFLLLMRISLAQTMPLKFHWRSFFHTPDLVEVRSFSYTPRSCVVSFFDRLRAVLRREFLLHAPFLCGEFL